MNEIEKNADNKIGQSPRNDGSKIKTAVKKIKGVKNIEIIVAVIAVVVMLAIYFAGKAGSAKKPQAAGAEFSENYCAKIERELTAALSSLKGAGRVGVMINWESGVESVIAYITNTSGGSSASTPQIIQNNGSTRPIVLKEIYPKALGVIIICEGGDNVATKLDIISAVSTLLDITPDKISVYTMAAGK
ncbi:MAG: hypothetical protein LBP26_03435 [Clostridiales bacterium]|jgi:stage III sporulation protein AG|nr:hypothetical protein [Clostridiales bacterium]